MAPEAERQGVVGVAITTRYEAGGRRGEAPRRRRMGDVEEQVLAVVFAVDDVALHRDGRRTGRGVLGGKRPGGGGNGEVAEP